MMTKKIEGTFPEDSSTVSLGVFEQVKWERDVALDQLKELGYGLGEKIRTDEDCISRKAVLDLAEKGVLVSNGNYKSVCKAINELPSVKPKFTDEEIQTMQDLEQAQIQKAYELGMAEVKCVEDCISREAAVDIAKNECNHLKIAIALERLPFAKQKPEEIKQDEEIRYTSKNGYTGVLYRHSSLSIYGPDGKESFHTGFRIIHTYEELVKIVDDHPGFIKSISRMIEQGRIKL